MKTILMILAVAALLVGALWTGQGLGLIHWPASSFMLDQRPWAARGALMMGVGAVLLWMARRRG
ncbi:MAG TPA: hypothetical protein VF649_14850 [Sphingomonas sp.]|jgi:hypothetical protein|uniref:hypothetical protein n=1 Tax=Sphingomonas sp. TaxID=28214 RepID=UPI002ED982CD